LSKRKGKGEGSIYRRKDGLWVGQNTTHSESEKKAKHIYGKTRKVVATKLAKAIADHFQGRNPYQLS
jgi:hypothetical protein